VVKLRCGWREIERVGRECIRQLWVGEQLRFLLLLASLLVRMLNMLHVLQSKRQQAMSKRKKTSCGLKRMVPDFNLRHSSNAFALQGQPFLCNSTFTYFALATCCEALWCCWWECCEPPELPEFELALERSITLPMPIIIFFSSLIRIFNL